MPVTDLHYVYQWLSTFSTARFIFEAVMLKIYGFGRCGPKEIQPLLYTMNLVDEDYPRVIGMLIFTAVVYRIIAFYLLIVHANPIENRRKRVIRIAKYREVIAKAKDSLSAGNLAALHDFHIRVTSI